LQEILVKWPEFLTMKKKTDSLFMVLIIGPTLLLKIKNNFEQKKHYNLSIDIRLLILNSKKRLKPLRNIFINYLIYYVLLQLEMITNVHIKINFPVFTK